MRIQFGERHIERGHAVDTFVAQRNVAHLRHELENGASGERRDTMLRLLVQEEDKLGLTEEQLGEMDRQIARMQHLVSEQLELIARFKAYSQSVEQAERALHNIIDVLVVHQARRTKIESVLPIGTVPRRPATISLLRGTIVSPHSSLTSRRAHSGRDAVVRSRLHLRRLDWQASRPRPGGVARTVARALLKRLGGPFLLNMEIARRERPDWLTTQSITNQSLPQIP